MFKKILLILSMVVICAPIAKGWALDENKIIIAIQPTSTSEQLNSQAKELETFLEERLKRDVEIMFPMSYAGVIEALRFGHAHAAFMGSWPAALAQSKAGAEIALAEVRDVVIDQDKTEAPYYFSYWIVLKDSPYKNLTELKGKKAAFSSALSSSGYVAPMSRLVELGFVTKKDIPVDAKDYFGEVLFAGGYAQAWEALKAGQVDVTVIAGDVPEKLYREVLDGTRVLEKQGPIPSHVVVLNKDMDKESKDRLVHALLELNDPISRDLMKKFVSGIFVRFEIADAQHLKSLERMLDLTGFEFSEKK